MNSFTDLDLSAPVQRALKDLGYETPTPIQAQAIPLLLDGRDVLGCAQTGTGKTAAFSLPIIDLLLDDPIPQGKRPTRVLILAPTRELAAQIEENVGAYAAHTQLRHAVIFGGVSQRSQERILSQGVDILVATPGRLLDLVNQKIISLKQVEFFVLDEADRMLDMGFVHDIKRVIKLIPEERQTLLFSATMPKSMIDFAQNILYKPARIDITPESPAVERIEQSVMFVPKAEKRNLLTHLLRNLEIDQAIVFSRTKHGANRIVKQLEKDDIQAAAIHGNKSQNARRRALDAFKEGTMRVLVATDIAARGIDVEAVSHVFNFDLPNESETYVHRIGRTARAGREGVAIAFCDKEEGGYLRGIEKLIGHIINVQTDHPWHDDSLIPSADAKPPKGRPGGGGGGRGRSNGRGRGGGGGGRGGSGGGGRGGSSSRSGNKGGSNRSKSSSRSPSRGSSRSSGGGGGNR